MKYEDEEFEAFLSASLGALAEEITESDLRPEPLVLAVPGPDGGAFPDGSAPGGARKGPRFGARLPWSGARSPFTSRRSVPVLVAAAVVGVLMVGVVATLGAPDGDRRPSASDVTTTPQPRTGDESTGGGTTGATSGAPLGPGDASATAGAPVPPVTGTVPPPGTASPSTGAPATTRGPTSGGAGAPNTTAGKPSGTRGSTAGPTGSPPPSGTSSPTATPTGTGSAPPNDDAADCRNKMSVSLSGLPSPVVFRRGTPVEFTARWTYSGTGTCRIPSVVVYIWQSDVHPGDVDYRIRPAGEEWQNPSRSYGPGGPSGTLGTDWLLKPGDTVSAQFRITFAASAEPLDVNVSVHGNSPDLNGYSQAFSGTVAAS